MQLLPFDDLAAEQPPDSHLAGVRVDDDLGDHQGRGPVSITSQHRLAQLGLRVAPLLEGFRGRPPARLRAVVEAVRCVADFARGNAAWVTEVDVNPLLAGPERAVAVDTLVVARAPTPA